jgi:hypothetical protein
MLNIGTASSLKTGNFPFPAPNSPSLHIRRGRRNSLGTRKKIENGLLAYNFPALNTKLPPLGLYTVY